MAPDESPAAVSQPLTGPPADVANPDSPSLAYWEAFYASPRQVRLPSDFAREVAAWLNPGTLVVDVGSGNGRDTRLFEALGHDVVAMDASVAAIRLVRAEAGPRVSTALVDLDDPNSPSIAVEAVAARRHPGAVAVYARFLLQAVGPAAEGHLLRLAADVLRPGERAFLEFRVAPPPGGYAFGEHRRRMVDPDQLTARASDHGLEPLSSAVSDGFAVYRSERPLVARVVLRRAS